jgi:spore cortex formation protein SpoVR/YcgB (stage V sporulation)
MCKNPTEEDLLWFPQLKGENSWDVIKDIVANYNDSSLISQWLSPKVIRDFGFFTVRDERTSKHYEVVDIHNQNGYQNIRQLLSDNYLISNYIPRLEIINCDRMSRKLTIKHYPYKDRQLGNKEVMMTHLKKLWGGHEVEILN